MTGALKFNVREIKEKRGSHESRSVPSADIQEGLEGAAVLKGPISSEFDFFVRGPLIVVKGLLSGRWELECGRCLKPGPSDYAAKVETEFSSSLKEIDATDEVRQALVLAVPIRWLCKPDCKGLCPSCKGDRNVKDCGCSDGSAEMGSARFKK